MPAQGMEALTSGCREDNAVGPKSTNGECVLELDDDDEIEEPGEFHIC